MNFIKKREFWYYFFLVAGGMWHILGLFQDIMKITAGSVMILICFLAVWDVKDEIKDLKAFMNFLLNIAFISFAAEWIGTMKGWLFGDYDYGHVLQPAILDIPIAIAFAWVSVLILSASMANHLYDKNNLIIKSLISGALMTFFDLIMEPAAIKLNYWRWVGNAIPLFNYLTWFLLGTAFSFYGYKKGFLNDIKEIRSVHLYFAQMIYFLLVLAS